MEKVKAIGHYLKNTDLYLLILALVCSAYGLALIYSATLNPVSWQDGSTRNLLVQGAAIVLGVVMFVLMSLVDLESMSSAWKFFVIGNVVLQFLLFTPLGIEINGQRAWLDLGVTSLQPGELGKLIFIFTFAAHLSELREHLHELRGVALLVLHTLIMMGAIMLSSGDTGMAIQYLMIALIMLFAAGLPFRWIGIGLAAVVASVPILWNFVLQDYHKLRILVLFDPSIDPDTARQTLQAQIAIGSGQMSGQGLTNGAMTQMQMVSENQTDMILSVAGEELGFIGCAAIVALLVLLIARLFYVSFRGSTKFSSYMAVGIAGMFLFQTFMNIFMVIGLLPVMGLTLPFFSYGGTSVVTMFAALGIAAGVRMREKPSWLQ